MSGRYILGLVKRNVSMNCLLLKLKALAANPKADLGFVEGDIIEVLNTGDGNWWTGRLKRNKVMGSFPMNFVEPYYTKGGISSTIYGGPTSQEDDPLKDSFGSDNSRKSQNRPLDDMDIRIASMVEQLSISQGIDGDDEQQNPTAEEDEEEQQEADAIDDYYDSYDTELPREKSPLSLYQHDRETDHYLDDGVGQVGDQQDYYQGDDDDYATPEAEQPPVPPPHGSVTSFSNSRVASDSTAKLSMTQSPSSNGTRPIDRTPSPLRNAMDGVMATLDNLDDMSRENSLNSYKNYQTENEKRNSVLTLTGSVTAHGSIHSKAGRGSVQSLNLSPRKDTFGSTGSLRNRFPERSSFDDEDGMALPFNPDSYMTSTADKSQTNDKWRSSDRQQKLSVRKHQSLGAGLASNAFARTDTYKSVSSIHTNSLSIHSTSTTPSSVSNFSATSAGSLARRKSEAQVGYRPSIDMVCETPTKLPNVKPSDSKSVKSLKLKRSAGFLRRLFTGGNSESKNEPIAGEGFYDSTSLKRTKSRSSRMSISSSSSRFRKSISGFGRSRNETESLYSRKSMDGLGPGGGSSWMDIRRDVHRSNSLTDNELLARRRKLELSGIYVSEPYIALSKVQGRESVDGELIGRSDRRWDPASQNYSAIDNYIMNIRTWPSLMTPQMFAQSKIGRNFQYESDRVRAVFDFCASKISWEPSDHLGYHDIHGDSDDELMKLARLMQNKRGTSFEIALCFRAMLETLEVECRVIEGHLKTPGEVIDKPVAPKANHAWNAVAINGEWRFVDCSLANFSFANKEYYGIQRTKSVKKGSQLGSSSAYLMRSGSIMSNGGSISSHQSNGVEDGVDYFFYLVDPFKFIHSHVPCDQRDQFLLPPLSDIDALGLPLAAPEAFISQVRFTKYQTGQTRLDNLEIAELTLEAPSGIDLYAEILAGNTFNMSLVGARYDETQLAKIHGLAQPYWEKNRRYFRVKAFLPEPFSQGILNIYAGPSGTMQSVTKNTLPLAYSLPLTHSGPNAPFEFITRHPTPHCKRQDIYVIQPQCKQLSGGNLYVFQVKQHPSGGITAGSGFGRVKIAIQSPSGKISKMTKHDIDNVESGDVYGGWEVSIKCHEVGTWRGLVLADSGNAWSVFAEWDCV